MMILKSNEYVGQEHALKALSRTPQLDYPEHSHDFSELILVRGGCGIHVVNGEQSVVLPNTIACVSEHDYHQYTDNKDVTLLNILYNKDCLSISGTAADVIKRLEYERCHFLINESSFKYLDNIAQRIEHEQESTDRHSQVMVSLLFEQLLISLDRLDSDKYQNSAVMQAIIYICNNYTESSLSINQVCELFKVSSKVLGNQINELTGMAPIRFINHLRVQRAISLLKTGMAITNVAYEVGYNDSNYFSTKFKSVTGKAPKYYQAK